LTLHPNNPLKMKNMTFKSLAAASATLLIALLTSQASAQNISWGSAQAIAGDASLSIAGVYFDALIPEYTGTALSADGVNFNNDTALTASGGGDGIISYAWNGGGNSRYDFSGTFTLGSASFNAVMEAGGAYVGNGTATGSVTMSGLTAGHNYLVQDFEYDNGNGGATVLGGSTPVTITGGSIGGQGEFVTGTFTATGSTEAFSLTGSDPAFTVLGSLSVRDITSVPEPSAILILAGGSVLMLALFGMGQYRKQTAC
jgi:hypothetical protein